ncbi:type II toxin-antitoxin system RelE/ParE family toxin [Maricaulis maris]|uniref:type II toxin-antitoxin system RelE/ParE family toxin n=1 Tax=Maricaulis maris TaxID=74318 RepID=UPI0026F1FF46|nr:type II toxin-antitoxin system RelE/ParE family toxin [Maricaulis maris]
MKLVLSPDALDDFARLRAYLADHNHSASARAARLLVDAAESLFDFPRRGAPTQADAVRELLVPFWLCCVFDALCDTGGEQELINLRIWHSRESHP